MSEYQCYEFVALDRPLTAKQMQELRAISSRAEISPTRFWNEYQWGNLRADPAKLVERYFDAHLYFANWGTHRLMLRIPLTRVDAKRLHEYFVGDRARVTGAYVILDLHTEDEERDFDEDSEGGLAAVVSSRTELMRGDLRVAYLAWLLAVQAGDVADNVVEPPVPPGLSHLTAAQLAMVQFLRIDEDLLAAAATLSAAESDDTSALRAWTLGLTARAKDEWLGRAAADPDLALGGELQRAFRASAKPVRRAGRRVADLHALADEMRARRKRAEKQGLERREKAKAAARNKRLDALGAKLATAWVDLEALVDDKAYDDAFKLASDLRDLATRDAAPASFATQFDAMRKRLLRRRGFFDRWKRENEPTRW